MRLKLMTYALRKRRDGEGDLEIRQNPLGFGIVRSIESSRNRL